MARPQGAFQIAPTQSDVKSAFLKLKRLADEGDPVACAELIRLHKENQLLTPHKLINGRLVEIRG